VSRHQKGKTNLDLLEQEIVVSGSGISYAICKSAACPRQMTTPAPHHSVFTGQMPLILPPNQQRQSTEGMATGVSANCVIRILTLNSLPILLTILKTA